MRNLLFFAIAVSFYSMHMYAQGENDTIPADSASVQVWHIPASSSTQSSVKPDTPPTPQAVAFNRLGDYQVNNNYGAPDISVPLFEIDFHGYKIPLTLHYEATPLKSGYNYDVTGLGWTLSGNSCVSRTIKDRADEVTIFSSNQPFQLDYNTGDYSTYPNLPDLFDKVNYQYDSYNILLPSGRSIPFLMHKESGHLEYQVMNSDTNVKIQCGHNPQYNSIDYFTVTDENGIIYHFGQAEKGANNFQNAPDAMRNVTWLLTSINIPSRGSITYDYTNVVSINTAVIDEPVLRVSRFTSQMYQDSPHPRIDVTKTLQSLSPMYEMKFIKSIHYGPTTIDFDYADQGLHMKDIVVTDLNDTIRHISLNIEGSQLTSLTLSGQGSEDRLVYGFTYQNNDFNNPTRAGVYTDYWGNLCESNIHKDLGNFNIYYNNKEANGLRFSTENLQAQLDGHGNHARVIPNNDTDPYFYYKLKLQSESEGDTRAASSPESHGILSTITYPNGGHTSFTFENNRFPTATAADGHFVFDRRNQRIIEGGGFRIKSIINYTADNTIASQDHYRYGFTYEDILNRNFPLPLPESYNLEDHIGCGEAVVDPNIFTFMTFSIYDGLYSANSSYSNIEFLKMLVGRESVFENFYNIQGSAWWWDADFSANTFRTLLGGRHPVVYPEITVYHGDPEVQGSCQSKTVYKFDIYSYEHNPLTYYLSSFNDIGVTDTAYFEPLYYIGNAPRLVYQYHPGLRHRLDSSLNYSLDSDGSTWNLVSEETYNYSNEELVKSGMIFNSRISMENAPNYSNDFENRPWWEQCSLNDFYLYQVINYSGRSELNEKITTNYRQGGSRTFDNTQEETFSYQYPNILKQKVYSDIYDRDLGVEFDRGNRYSYVGQESNTDPVISEMKSRNMLASLISSELVASHLYAPMILEGTRILYDFYDYDILPSTIYEWVGDNDGNGSYEASFSVLSYDDYGNPTEICDLRTGMKSVYLWDPYGRYMTAMINNAELSQVQNAYSQIESENSQSRYITLKTLLPESQIETWDYSPLVGVSAYTNNSGHTSIYEYDGLGRLKKEKRKVNGTTTIETLKEYEYNYQN